MLDKLRFIVYNQYRNSKEATQMTHYEIQIARNKKYADRIKVLTQTPTLLIFEVDNEIVYCHKYDSNGCCIDTFWYVVKH